MKIVCLANSFRVGGRCLGGIELDQNNNPVIQNGRPFRIKWMEERISPKTAYKYQWRHRLEQPLPCVMTRKIRKNYMVFLFYELLYHLSLLPSALQPLYSILYKIRRIEIMPHFPGWFVAICVLLPVCQLQHLFPFLFGQLKIRAILQKYFYL